MNGFVPHCGACGHPLPSCACYSAQMTTIPPPIMPPAQPNRWRVRYGVNECTICGMAAQYCKGHVAPDAPSNDGAESGLARRIAQARGDR